MATVGPDATALSTILAGLAALAVAQLLHLMIDIAHDISSIKTNTDARLTPEQRVLAHLAS